MKPAGIFTNDPFETDPSRFFVTGFDGSFGMQHEECVHTCPLSRSTELLVEDKAA